MALGVFWMVLSIVTATAGELPNLEQGLDKGKCTKFPTPGADQYFVGTWTLEEDGVVSGTETRILFANPKWKSRRGPDGKVGRDCVVVWNITGHRSDPVTCTGCDFGLKFQASVDYTKSTCPQRLYNEGAYRGGHYDVSLRSDGTTAMYFSRTGKQFATGHHVKGSLNYKTPHACVWF